MPEVKVHHHSFWTTLFIALGAIALVAIAYILFLFYQCACGSTYTSYDKGGDYGKKCYSEKETCLSATDCCTGICTDGVCASTKEVGCLDTDVACSSHESCCSGFCKDGKCYKEETCKTVGYNCESAYDCCSDLVCEFSAGQSTGTCQISCGEGLGGACSDNSDCCSGCCMKGVCKSAESCVTCASEGQNCGSLYNDAKCCLGLTCTSNVCKTQSSVTPSCRTMDQSCTTDDECCSGKCYNSICQSA